MTIRTIIILLSAIFFTSESNAQKSYVKTGIASFYADKFEGRPTANGEIYYHAKRTAAHLTLPFGSIVKVTNLENNKYVVVRVNDRGPFVDNRIIDLSKSAAIGLDFVEKGLAKVKVELIASTDDLPDAKVNSNEDKSSTNYYKINAEKVYPKGKGVQIASFKNNENVFRLVEELNNKYNEEVFIEFSQVKKHQVYRIIIGNYTSDAKLEALKKVLSVDYPGCFIVTFKN
jgi:rare lipoprotein A